MRLTPPPLTLTLTLTLTLHGTIVLLSNSQVVSLIPLFTSALYARGVTNV